MSVEDVPVDRGSARRAARQALGVGEWDESGDASQERPASLRSVVATSGVGFYPLLAIGSLVVVDELFGFVLSVLGPEISRALGMSKGALAGVLSAKLLAVSVATLPMAALVQRRPWRASISLATAFAWTAATFLAVLVIGPWGLLVVVVIDGLSSGSVRVLHQPLLMDWYPNRARVRVQTAYAAAVSIGSVIAPLLVGVLTAWAGLTWRGVFLAVGLASLLAALFALRLRDPGVGHSDDEPLRDAISDSVAGAGGEHIDVEVPALRFAEVVRRLLMIPTIRRLLAAQAVFGVLVVPYSTFLLFFLDERWDMGPGGRSVFFAASAVGAVVALRFFGPVGERLFRSDPARLVRVGSLLLGASVLAIVAGALVPVFALMIVCFMASSALAAALGPSLIVTMLGVVPPAFRSHLAALAGMYTAGVGGFAGALLLGTVDRRYGTAGALVAIVIPGLVGAWLLRGCASTVNDDLDRMIDELVDETALEQQRRQGAALPALSCRGLDVGYGQVQVLFGVDFRVDEGEMVALLGTNGAGKSTVLRTVCGLNLPWRGSVRLAGRDITWLDPERRLPLGLTQIPGGRATFGPLSVIDNLRAHAYSLGGDRALVESRIDEAFDAFPRLAERRNQPAATMSGGEQQMLALSKALVVRPRVLLIDELSLGLAPVVVGELLAIVRTINARGSAVVLVEQSINVALSLADRAYFLERGRVQFEGRSTDLSNRDDLLRSVFLGQAPT
ncbi:MAG: MFS transporter [Actinobacteria bacterium]|nr:MFS transporter [Actinomycetota bacterium]